MAPRSIVSMRKNRSQDSGLRGLSAEGGGLWRHQCSLAQLNETYTEHDLPPLPPPTITASERY